MNLFRMFQDPEPDPEIIARLDEIRQNVQSLMDSHHQAIVQFRRIEDRVDRIIAMLGEVTAAIETLKHKPVEKKRADKNPPD